MYCTAMMFGQPIKIDGKLQNPRAEGRQVNGDYTVYGALHWVPWLQARFSCLCAYTMYSHGSLCTVQYLVSNIRKIKACTCSYICMCVLALCTLPGIGFHAQRLCALTAVRQISKYSRESLCTGHEDPKYPVDIVKNTRMKYISTCSTMPLYLCTHSNLI